MRIEVLKNKKVPHLEGLSSNYSKLFRVVYKGSLADAKMAKNVAKYFVVSNGSASILRKMM